MSGLLGQEWLTVWQGNVFHDLLFSASFSRPVNPTKYFAHAADGLGQGGGIEVNAVFENLHKITSSCRLHQCIHS